VSDVKVNRPPPRWLLRLTAVSVSLAVLALLALMWARWGLVVVLMSGLIKYCF
jgi:hypothetical protein